MLLMENRVESVENKMNLLLPLVVLTVVFAGCSQPGGFQPGNLFAEDCGVFVVRSDVPGGSSITPCFDSAVASCSPAFQVQKFDSSTESIELRVLGEKGELCEISQTVFKASGEKLQEFSCVCPRAPDAITMGLKCVSKKYCTGNVSGLPAEPSSR